MQLLLSKATEPGSFCGIVLAKHADNFALNSCKTLMNVHDVHGCGFQMALQHLGSFLIKIVSVLFS